MNNVKLSVLFLFGLWVSALSSQSTGIAKETKNSKTSLSQRGIPVLCYHRILSNQEAKKNRSPFNISRKQFANQMHWLYSKGYKTINLNQFYANLRKPESKKKLVLLTFDDGRKDFIKEAMPVLKKYKFQSTLFIFPEPIVKKSSQFLSWPEVQTIIKQGHDVQSHSFSHPLLHKFDRYKQESQFVRARELLQKNTRKKIMWIAYPYGTYNSDTQRLLKKQGYSGAFTVFNGSNLPGDDPLFYNRYVVLKGHTLKIFKERFNIRGLKVSKVSPPNGSYVKTNQLISMNIPKGLDSKQIRVGLGDRFIGENPSVSFQYDKKSGHIIFFARKPARVEFLIATIYYLSEEATYQRSVMFLANRWQGMMPK